MIKFIKHNWWILGVSWFTMISSRLHYFFPFSITEGFTPSFGDKLFWVTSALFNVIVYLVIYLLVSSSFRFKNEIALRTYQASLVLLASIDFIRELLYVCGVDVTIHESSYIEYIQWAFIISLTAYIFRHLNNWKWENITSDEYDPTKVQALARQPRRLIEHISAFFSLVPPGAYKVTYGGMIYGFSKETKKLSCKAGPPSNLYIIKDIPVDPKIFIAEAQLRIRLDKKYNYITNNCTNSWEFTDLKKLFKVKSDE